MSGTNYEGKDAREPTPEKLNTLAEIQKDIGWISNAEIEILDRLYRINGFLFHSPSPQKPKEGGERESRGPQGKLQELSDSLRFIKENVQNVFGEIDLLLQLLPKD